jgi:hypothetical protein
MTGSNYIDKKEVAEEIICTLSSIILLQLLSFGLAILLCVFSITQPSSQSLSLYEICIL